MDHTYATTFKIQFCCNAFNKAGFASVSIGWSNKASFAMERILYILFY